MMHGFDNLQVGAVTKLILVLQKGSNIALRKLCGGNTSTGGACRCAYAGLFVWLAGLCHPSAAAVGKKSAKKRNHKPETEDGDASSGEENR